jgi:general secretion pathway protein N
MKRFFTYFIIAVISFAVFLIVTLPARYAYEIAKSHLNPVELHYLEGTIWNGRAGTLIYNKTTLGSLSWELHPHDLLRGHFEADISAVLPDGNLTATTGSELFGAVYAKDLNGDAPALLLAQQVGLAQFSPQGKIYLAMTRMEFSPKGRLEEAEGSITWEQAGIAFPGQLSLGNLHILVNTDKDGIKFKISDKDAPIRVRADLLVCPDGKYELNGYITPTDAARPALERLLGDLGKLDEQGSIRLKYNGRLPRQIR